MKKTGLTEKWVALKKGIDWRQQLEKGRKASKLTCKNSVALKHSTEQGNWCAVSGCFPCISLAVQAQAESFASFFVLLQRTKS